MRIINGIDNLPKFKNAVVTIGSYDGLHQGHLYVLSQLNKKAKEVNGESVVITFDPHPRSIIFPKDNSLKLLSTREEKIRLFEKTPVDNLVIVPFTIEFSQIDPREYVESFLLKKFDPRAIIIGYDHKFGLNRTGNIDLLRQYEVSNSLEIIEIPAHQLEKIAISSSKIRVALKDGDVIHANDLLGRKYAIEGMVVHGQKIGKSLGFPTANLKISNPLKLVPSDGIYAVKVHLEEQVLGGMMYIGKKPTLEGKTKESVIEVNIFDFHSDIYAQNLKVELVDFVREDMTFEGLEALRLQIEKDELKSREILQASTIQSTHQKLAVVILNYNGQEYLESFLPAVADSYSEDFEIIVIDNASTDNSVEYLNEWHPEVSIIELSKNLGYAGGYNAGLTQVTAQYYVLLNSDILVTNNWLDPIIAEMDKDMSLAACQPKIKSLEEKDKFEYAGAAGGMMDSHGYPFCIGRIFDTVEVDQGQYDANREIFWASGAAMVVRADVFTTFGGFDADYFAHQEEIDFCWRVKRAGYRIKAINESEVFHLGGGTLSYNNPRKTYLNFRNNLITIIKNEKGSSLIWKVIVRKGLDFVAILKFLISGELANASAIIKAYWYNFVNMSKTLKKRKYISALIEEHRIDSENTHGILSKSIIVSYFLKGKKTWKEINE